MLLDILGHLTIPLSLVSAADLLADNGGNCEMSDMSNAATGEVGRKAESGSIFRA